MSASSRRLAQIAITTLCFALAGTIFVLGNFRDASVVPAKAQAGLQTLILDGRTIYVSIADTEEEQRQGLSGRERLAPNHGMLFIFGAEGKYPIWMKDMLFAIDILWIANDGTIIHIASNISPETYPASFVSEKLARYVLELPAGYVKEHAVAEGDKLVI